MNSYEHGKRKTFLAVMIVLSVVIVGGIFVWNDNRMPSEQKKNESKNDIFLLTEEEARVIAEKICVKGGEALSSGTYNQNTKTWWFDADLNAAYEGCHPACVVSEESKTAEINWRCTGLKDSKL